MTQAPAAAAEFGPFDGRIWLNTAHQGPLPRPAVEMAGQAAALKAAPHRIGDDDFSEVPERLRALLARLVGGAPGQVVLGNSTSYGLHLVANGLAWEDGDEVLVIEGDYPATILPWQRLAPRGVRVRPLRPAGERLTPAELAAAIRPRTRLLAVTWVDSFTGRALDLDELGAVCRQAGVPFVVNASQALGARPLDVSATPVDAVIACGYKWLCGPYGTGFAWLHPDLLGRLRPQQAYWLAMQAGRGLDQMRGTTTVRDDLGVRAFDVFCPASFATTLPWIASLELFLEAGIGAIAGWDAQLVDRFVAGIDPERYRLVSPASGPARSTLVVLSPAGGGEKIQRRLAGSGIDIAYREGNLRISVHLFNEPGQIDKALAALHADGPR
jgi:selenocysteine lyase/cysteine desulfurase